MTPPAEEIQGIGNDVATPDEGDVVREPRSPVVQNDGHAHIALIPYEAAYGLPHPLEGRVLVGECPPVTELGFVVFLYGPLERCGRGIGYAHENEQFQLFAREIHPLCHPAAEDREQRAAATSELFHNCHERA